MTPTTNSIDSDLVKQAALETADPEAIVNEALAQLSTDASALYQEPVIAALKAIRQKDELAYTRLCMKAGGHKTRLDKLTKPDRGDFDESMHDRVIQIVQAGCSLGHDPDGRGVALIEGDTHRQVWFVDGHGFKEWVRSAYFEATRSGINANALDTAIATIAAIGKHQGTEMTVHIRAARHGDDYYLDLCDEAWRAIRINRHGWAIVTRPPVLFTRNKNMRPIPMPGVPGDISQLWQHINIPAERQLMLLTWILDAYRPDTPFPILELSGEQGSAKSSTQRRLRDLIDPNKVALRGRPKSVDDIYVGAYNNWIVSFENLSHLTPEQQDVCCTLSTGGGYAARQLYTNGDEHVMETKRPVMINGINAVATQPDLIERVISIEAPTIPSDQRRDEQTLEAAWQADYPAVFATILDLFAKALALLPEIKLNKKQRMADYQLLGEAVARALGHAEGVFSTAYSESAGEGIDRSLETYGVSSAIEGLMAGRRKPWEGNVMTLLSELGQQDGLDRSNWPKSPRGLSGQIKRIAPGLRQRGITVENLARTRNGAQLRITLSDSG